MMVLRVTLTTSLALGCGTNIVGDICKENLC